VAGQDLPKEEEGERRQRPEEEEEQSQMTEGEAVPKLLHEEWWAEVEGVRR
jgi:hypothetical protein